MSIAKSSPLPRTEMDALLLGRLDELTVNEPSSRGRSLLGIVLSIVVLIVISTFIVAAITLINPDIASQFSARRLQAREAISLEEIFTGSLASKKFTYAWHTTARNEYQEQEGAARIGVDELLFEHARDIKLLTLNYTNNYYVNNNNNNNNLPLGNKFSLAADDNEYVKTLISASSLLSSINYQDFKLSASKRFLLLSTGRIQQFRSSFTAKYFLYDIKLDLITMLSSRRVATNIGQHVLGANKPTRQSQPQSQSQSQSQPRQQENQYESLDSASLYLNNGGVADGNRNGGGEQRDELFEGEQNAVRFQMAKWFVDSRGLDSLLLIQNNDLYVLTNVAKLGLSASQDGTFPIRLTQTGEQGLIFNGLPDWLYEEEIMTTGAPANEISPSGTHLAYLSFNDTQVSQVPIVWYTGNQVAVPRVQQLRYPLAGTPNPQVQLHIIENFATIEPLASATGERSLKQTLVTLPGELANRQHYLYRIKWLTNERLGVIWTNRHQNESRILVCEPPPPQLTATSGGKNWNCERSITIDAPGGWLDIGDDLYPLDDHYYLTIMPKFESDQVGTFKHLARVSLEQPDEFIFLTSGEREVMQIVGLDRARSLVYYTSTLAGHPGQKRLFAVNWQPEQPVVGLHTQATTTCITCDLSSSSSDTGGGGGGGECLHSDAKLSPSARHLILECNGPDIPRTELRELVHGEPSSPVAGPVSLTSRLLWTIEANGELRARLARVKAMPVTVRLRMPISHTNYTASVLLLLPPLFAAPTTMLQKSTGHLADSSGFAWPEKNGNLNLQSQTGRHKRDARTHPPVADQHETGLEQIAQYIRQVSSSTGSGANNHQGAGGAGGGGGAGAGVGAGGGGFPMVVEVYGGPSQQKVDYQMAIQVGHYFATSRRTIYAMIDGRGSGKEGSRRMFEMFGQFGKVEVEDQIDVTRKLIQGPLATLVDPTKVAIWGWSYGGYVAAMVLARSNMETRRRTGRTGRTWPTNSHNSAILSPPPPPPPVRGVFECAASMAPTTNLIYYDTAYSERYLQSPWKNNKYDLHTLGDHLHSDNISNQTISSGTIDKWNLIEDLNERYKSSSLLEYIGQISGKRFLLMHGTADDNVHIQNSFRLMQEMIKQNIPFETRLYTDQRHGLADLANNLHLHNTLSNFLAECFDRAH